MATRNAELLLAGAQTGQTRLYCPGQEMCSLNLELVWDSAHPCGSFTPRDSGYRNQCIVAKMTQRWNVYSGKAICLVLHRSCA